VVVVLAVTVGFAYGDELKSLVVVAVEIARRRCGRFERYVL